MALLTPNLMAGSFLFCLDIILLTIHRSTKCKSNGLSWPLPITQLLTAPKLQHHTPALMHRHRQEELCDWTVPYRPLHIVPVHRTSFFNKSVFIPGNSTILCMFSSRKHLQYCTIPKNEYCSGIFSGSQHLWWLVPLQTASHAHPLVRKY